MWYTLAMTDLSPAVIARALSNLHTPWRVLYLEQTGSTNDVARGHARRGAGEGLLVIAEEQTGGRGRLDRSWWAPAGACLLMSLLLRPAIPAAQSGRLTMCLGLAAVEGIEDTTGVVAGLKWPNDVVLAGHKLGGMLAEAELAGESIAYAVLGLGLNVNVGFHGPGVPPGLSATATSLSAALGHPVARASLLSSILARFEHRYTRLLAGESPHDAWAARLVTLGQRVTVSGGEGILAGAALGVTPEGALIVRDDAGREHVVWSGDVTSVRQAPAPRR
jgi:BirA family transcriptional regulator, biotin operon repressor / biotin---[acetyl-CoA-carboxylase] ligase